MLKLFSYFAFTPTATDMIISVCEESHLRHVVVVGDQVPLWLWLEVEVLAGEAELRLVDLHHVPLRVPVIRPHPQVHQHARVEPLERDGLSTGRQRMIKG